MNARNRIAAAGESLTNFIIADFTRHLDDGVIAVQIDFGSCSVDTVESLFHADFAVAAGNALNINDFRFNNHSVDLFLGRRRHSASAAAAFPAPMFNDTFESKIKSD